MQLILNARLNTKALDLSHELDFFEYLEKKNCTFTMQLILNVRLIIQMRLTCLMNSLTLCFRFR